MEWHKHDRNCPEDEGLSLIINACLVFKTELLQNPSHLPFPQQFTNLSFKVKAEGLREISLPLNLLFVFWGNVPEWTGKCAHCNSDAVYGIGAAGGLSTGGITGHCTTCHLKSHYWLGGLARVSSHLRNLIEDTNYSGDTMGMARFGPKKPLFKALTELSKEFPNINVELPETVWLKK